MAPHLTTLAQGLPSTVPFVGPETQERARGSSFRARLGANENGFGPSPAAIAAIAAEAGNAWKYCDPENHDLRVALARHHGVPTENLVVGEGIDGLLGLAVRLYVEPGATVVTSIGAYPTFNYHVAGFGGVLRAVPYSGDREDPDALAQAVRGSSASMVYFANPDNPMATCWDAGAAEAFLDAVPEDTLIILDEAYGEFAPAGTMPGFDTSRPNVLRMRTFSKAYGLAGLRCGYAVGHADVVGAFDKVRNHFGISRVTQAGCLAALADQEHLRQTVEAVATCRQRLYDIARDNGLTSVPSATNFVAIDCGQDGAFALRVLQNLSARGIFVRKPMAPGLDRCIRVSCGPSQEIELFAAELPGALAAAVG